MTHEELLNTPEYWTTKMQIELYNKVESYIKENGITRTELAKRLKVSKGYVTQVLNGDFDHRISKFVDLALFVGYYPKIVFEPIKKESDEEFIESIKNFTRQSLANTEYSAMFYRNGEKDIKEEKILKYKRLLINSESLENKKVIA